MSNMIKFLVVAIIGFGGAAIFFPVFSSQDNLSAIEPAAGDVNSQELEEVLKRSVEEANRAIEDANRKLQEQNTFETDAQ